MPTRKKKSASPRRRRKTTTRKTTARRRHGRHTISEKTLKAERKTGQYPLALAEKRLQSLFKYVKMQGGKLPG